VCLVEKGDCVEIISVVNSASSPLPTLSLSLHPVLKSDMEIAARSDGIIGHFDTEPTREFNSAHAIKPYISKLCAIETYVKHLQGYEDFQGY
jgi:hypothetical protein